MFPTWFLSLGCQKKIQTIFFLGSEWRYVILSTVCSLPSKEIVPEPDGGWLSKHIGFVGDPNQINVGITRAKEGLCIIGETSPPAVWVRHRSITFYSSCHPSSYVHTEHLWRFQERTERGFLYALLTYVQIYYRILAHVLPVKVKVVQIF